MSRGAGDGAPELPVITGAAVTESWHGLSGGGSPGQGWLAAATLQ